MDTLGIDIGTVSVKYVRVRGKGRKGLVVSKGTYPYTGELPQLEVLLSDIRAKEGSLRVAVGISSQDILKKSVTIPKLPKEEVKEALNWSVSKTIASPLEEMTFDYVMLGEVEERGIKKEEACFVGVQKAFSDNLLSSFRRSGFKETVLLTDIGFTYYGVVREGKGEPVAVIDVGGMQSGIYVFENRKMKLVREILIAAESFSDSLIEGIDLHSREREHLVADGFREGRVRLSDTSFDKLTEEVQRTFNVFEKRYPGKPLTKILVAGRGSQIPGFLPRMRERFGEIVEPLAAVKDLEPEFVPAFFLASYPERMVNLLPEDIREKEKEGVYRKWCILGSAGVAALLLVISLDMVARLNGLAATHRLEAANTARMREEVRMFSSAAQITKYDDLIPFMKEIEKKDETLVVLLKYFSSRLPKGVYLKSIEYGQENQLVPGVQATEKDLARKTPVPADLNRTSPKPETPLGKQQAPQPGERGQALMIKGYAFGEVDVADPALLDLVIKLGDTGIVRHVEVIERQVKAMKGKRVVEFTIMGWCAPYEV